MSHSLLYTAYTPGALTADRDKQDRHDHRRVYGWVHPTPILHVCCSSSLPLAAYGAEQQRAPTQPRPPQIQLGGTSGEVAASQSTHAVTSPDHSNLYNVCTTTPHKAEGACRWDSEWELPRRCAVLFPLSCYRLLQASTPACSRCSTNHSLRMAANAAIHSPRLVFHSHALPFPPSQTYFLLLRFLLAHLHLVRTHSNLYPRLVTVRILEHTQLGSLPLVSADLSLSVHCCPATRLFPGVDALPLTLTTANPSVCRYPSILQARKIPRPTQLAAPAPARRTFVRAWCGHNRCSLSVD